MGYRELVHKVQQKSGFSDEEAAIALDMLVASLAERLQEGEREKFASQLPAELQDIALGTELRDRDERKKDLIHEFMEKQNIDEARAKKQVLTAWETLKSLMTEGQIAHAKAQLSDANAEMLY